MVAKKPKVSWALMGLTIALELQQNRGFAAFACLAVQESSELGIMFTMASAIIKISV